MKNKSVFIFYSREEAKKFRELLADKLCLENISVWNYLGREVVDVLEDFYLDALEAGQEIGLENKFNMGWLDYSGTIHPINYVSVAYCTLPKTREGSPLWELFAEPDTKCPEDIKEFFENIKGFLERDIIVKHFGSSNAFEIFVKAKFSEYENIMEQLKKYIPFVQESPFTKIDYVEKDGHINYPEKKPESIFMSYFRKSLFVSGLTFPGGNNIVPKSNYESDDYEEGYKYNLYRAGTRELHINEDEVSLETITSHISGSYFLYEEKNYSYYWDGTNQINMEYETFLMYDEGEFSSEVSLRDGHTMCVTTKLDNVRTVNGYNYDEKSIRDGLLRDFPHTNHKGTLKIKEYFTSFADDTRLLHYSPFAESFEIYDLPNNWDYSQGLDCLGDAKVYNYEEIENDPDYEEINNILNSMGIGPKLVYTVKQNSEE